MVKSIGIYFTLDTICPFTYLGRRALQLAIEEVTAEQSDYTFEVHYAPYLIAKHLAMPSNASVSSDETGPEESSAIDKRGWYLGKCNGDEAMLEQLERTMLEKAQALGIEIYYKGVVANSVPAHMLILALQKKQEVDDETYTFVKMERFTDSLYKAYFTQGKHPSNTQTLAACIAEAELPLSSSQLIGILQNESLKAETLALVAEQEQNDVTGVPHIRIDGRRRDLTLIGAKPVAEYAAALRQILKEAR